MSKRTQIEYITKQNLLNVFGSEIYYDHNIKEKPIEHRYSKLTDEFTEFIRQNLIAKGVKNPYGFTELMEYLKMTKEVYSDLLNGNLNATLCLIAEVELYFGKQFIITEHD